MSNIFRQLNYHLSGKQLLIRFTARAIRKVLSIYVFSYFPFGFEGRIWDLIVSVPDHCLPFYFSNQDILVQIWLGEFNYSFLLTSFVLHFYYLI